MIRVGHETAIQNARVIPSHRHDDHHPREQPRSRPLSQAQPDAHMHGIENDIRCDMNTVR